MRRKKKQNGLTLIELLIAIPILLVVIYAAGSALYTAINAFALNRETQDHQYDARLALMSMTRDLRRGAEIIEAGENKLNLSNHVLTEEKDAAGNPVHYYAEENIRYYYDDLSGRLQREGLSPVPFFAAGAEGFTAEISEDGRFISLSINCGGGAVIQTRISLARIPVY